MRLVVLLLVASNALGVLQVVALRRTVRQHAEDIRRLQLPRILDDGRNGGIERGRR